VDVAKDVFGAAWEAADESGEAMVEANAVTERAPLEIEMVGAALAWTHSMREAVPPEWVNWADGLEAVEVTRGVWQASQVERPSN
jgi:hypothetical protein